MRPLHARSPSLLRRTPPNPLTPSSSLTGAHLLRRGAAVAARKGADAAKEAHEVWPGDVACPSKDGKRTVPQQARECGAAASAQTETALLLLLLLLLLWRSGARRTHHRRRRPRP
jgi:hypothetical protein